MIGPREDFRDWDDTWMGLAVWISGRSKDPNTQVGACIVDQYNHIVGLGYNGFPKDIDNNDLPWDRKGGFLDTKYAYMCHAESNAIDNSDCNRIRGSRIYVTLFPCNECAQRIIQKSIREVIYLSDKYHDTEPMQASRRLLELAKVKTRQLITDPDEIREYIIRLHQ